MSLTRGAEVVRKIESWFGQYLAMPREYALVAALWVLNTWQFKAFDATPYLVISGDTKQSGKTVFLEAVAMLSAGGKVRTDVTPPTMFRLLDAHNGNMTICIDEAEKLRHEKHPLRPFANAGYRSGQTIPRTMPDGTVRDFSVYCPKAFALIGDVWDTLRDRSIVVRLERGIPAKKFRRSEAEGEASALLVDIKNLWREMGGVKIAITEPTWLQGRDEEIWTPIISLAEALGLPKADMDRLIAASADMTARKTEKARKGFDNPDAELKAQDDQYAQRLLVDLATVLNPGERKIFSSVAVDRLKAIPTAPWRSYKGDGLNMVSLAGLLQRFGLSPETVHLENMRPGKTQAERRLSAKGYQAADIRKALARITGGLVEA